MDRGFVALAMVMLITSVAEAQRPCVEVWLGPASGSETGGDGRGAYIHAGVDGSWRVASGRSLVLDFGIAAAPSEERVFAELPAPQVALERSVHVQGVWHMGAGLELSPPAATAIVPFIRGTAGGGAIVTHNRWDGYSRPEPCFAATWALGLRLVPPPGPVGFLVELRSAHAWSRTSSLNVVGLAFGVTIRPTPASTRRRPALVPGG